MCHPLEGGDPVYNYLICLIKHIVFIFYLLKRMELFTLGLLIIYEDVSGKTKIIK